MFSPLELCLLDFAVASAETSSPMLVPLPRYVPCSSLSSLRVSNLPGQVSYESLPQTSSTNILDCISCCFVCFLFFFLYSFAEFFLNAKPNTLVLGGKIPLIACRFSSYLYERLLNVGMCDQRTDLGQEIGWDMSKP